MIENFNFNKNTYFIAEIGNNHEGSLQSAYDLIGYASESGANAVKFQTIVPKKLVAKTEKKRIKQLEKLCLKAYEFKKVAKFAKSQGVDFLSTPFDVDSVDLLEDLQAAYKIASGDNNNLELIEKILTKKKSIIISTGMTSLEEIKEIYKVIKKKKKEIGILHCVSAYPVKKPYANIGVVTTLQKEFPNCIIGYSDHLIGIKGAVYATILGAKIIEKHFTIDKKFSSFRDHKISATPSEFKRMVNLVEESKILIGDSVKKIELIEESNIPLLRRSIYSKKEIKKGEKLSKKNMTCLRPSNGLSAKKYRQVMGKKIKNNIQAGHPIFKKDIY